MFYQGIYQCQGPYEVVKLPTIGDIKDMLPDDLHGLRIWPVDITRNGSRAFGIDKAVVWRLDLVLPLRHGVIDLKEVTIASDVICCTSVKNPIVGRSICQCHIHRDHRVWRRVRDRVGMYGRDRVRMYDREKQ